MRLDLLQALNAERAERRACVLVTDLASHAQRLVLAGDVANDPLATVLQEHMTARKSGLVLQGNQEFFLSVQVPPLRLIAVGAVHISQALVPLAALVGLDMIIIDPRTAFATQERFPDVRLLSEWPETVLPEVGLDPYTAMVLLCHDPRIDDPALIAALRSECFYIGALGSRKTHQKRLERLRAEGFAESVLARIHAPIGLDIGAISPAEIAVSIMAELIASRRQKPLRPSMAAE
jgi:xanthine dehydrogenase accessory factor